MAVVAAARRTAVAGAAKHAARRSGRKAGPVVLALGMGSCLTRGFIGAWPSRASLGGSRTGMAFFGALFGSPQGSPTPIPDAPSQNTKHYVTGNAMYPPWPEGMEEAMFGMGCFWCSENLYMKLPGVHSTQVGYAGGAIENPSYADVCTGASEHNEVVRVIYDPKTVSYAELLQIFWQRHDPTTLNQQGGDRGTQYRSGIYFYNDNQKALAEETKSRFQKSIEALGTSKQISTEIVPAPKFYYAEDNHQQYDAKPGSRQYCGLSPLGAKLDVSNLDGVQA